MNISSNIGIPFLFALLIAVVSFTIQFIKSTKWFLRFSLHNILDIFFEGIALSGFLILFQLIFKDVDSHYQVPIIYAGIIIITLTRNRYIALFYIPLSLIYDILINSYNPLVFGPIAISFITMILNELLIAFDVKKRNSYLIFLLLVLSLSTFFIMLFISKSPKILIYSNSLFFGLATLVPLIFIILLSNILTSANILNDRIYYHYGNYYRSSFWKIPIFDKIKEEKINKGIFILFSINFANGSQNEKDEVKKTILTAIERRTKKQNPLLFHFEANIYGIFIKVKSKIDVAKSIKNNYLKTRPLDDGFRYFDELLKSLSGKYKTENKNNINASIQAGGFVYGQQDYSLSNIERFTLFALRSHHSFASAVNVFDYSLFRIRLNENEKIRALDYQIILEDYTNVFLPVINTKNETIEWNYLLTKNLHGLINEKTYDYVRSLNVEDIFKRYFATDALRKISGKKIKAIIPYSINYVLKDFKVEEFKKILHKNNVSLNNIALSFWISNKTNVADIQELVKILEKNKIKYVFEGDLNKISKLTKTLNPLMLINWEEKKTTIKDDRLVDVNTHIAKEKRMIILANNKQNIIPFKTGEKISI